MGLMTALLCIMVVLAINSFFMDGAKEGLAFYLVPDFGRMKEIGIVKTITGAMNQAFFTLSLGIGAMAMTALLCIMVVLAINSFFMDGAKEGLAFYLVPDFDRMKEIGIVKTITGAMNQAFFTFHVDQTSGPSLIFITLPNIFNHIPLGRLWGSLFFLFMFFAAFSTILAVFENIISCGMELTGCSRVPVEWN